MDFRDHMLAVGKDGHQWKTVNAGNFKVSIQASKYHYCSPRINSPNPFDYQQFEVAIFTPDDHWVVPGYDIEATWADKFENGVNGQRPRNSVAGYLTVDEVQQIVDDICNMGVKENE